MALALPIEHKSWLAATTGYELVSDNPEEIAYYNKIKAKINKYKKNRNMGIAREN